MSHILASIPLSNLQCRIDGTANAAYIVECVNSHAALVEQNRRLREALQKSVAFLEMRERGGDHSLAMKATVATARAALGGS